MPTLIDRSIKTRRSHRCDWCGEQIEKGETCRYWRGVTEGGWWRSWLHNACEKAYVAVRDDVGWVDGLHESGAYKRGSVEER